MWREHCEVDLDYHIRPWRLPAPGGRRELDDAIAASPAPRWTATVRCGRCTSSKAWPTTGSRWSARSITRLPTAARRQLDGPGMDLVPTPASGPRSPTPDEQTELLRSAFSDHLRQAAKLPATFRYTAQGIGRVRRSSRKLSPELTMRFTTPHLHQPPDHPGTPFRHCHPGARRHQGDRQAVRREHQRRGAGHLHRSVAHLAVALRRRGRTTAGLRTGEFRLLTGPDIGQLLHRIDGGAAGRPR